MGAAVPDVTLGNVDARSLQSGSVAVHPRLVVGETGAGAHEGNASVPSDRVKSACLAQLVNAISVIRSEPGGLAWRQTTFHSFALTARHAKGDVLEVALQSPTYETKQYGTVPVVDATATHDPVTGQVSLFAVNRSEADPVTLEVDLRALPALDAADAFALSDPDVSATNSQDHPDRVQPRSLAVHTDGSVQRLELPAVSWSCVRLSRRS